MERVNQIAGEGYPLKVMEVFIECPTVNLCDIDEIIKMAKKVEKEYRFNCTLKITIG